MTALNVYHDFRISLLKVLNLEHSSIAKIIIIHLLISSVLRFAKVPMVQALVDTVTTDVTVYPTNITTSIRPLVGQLIGLINSASKWVSATNASNTNTVPVRVSPS